MLQISKFIHQLAKKLGADGTFLIAPSNESGSKNCESKAISKRILTLFKGSRCADATIECCGAASRYGNYYLNCCKLKLANHFPYLHTLV